MDVRSQGHAEADLSTPRSGGPEMILLQNSEGFSDTRCHEGKNRMLSYKVPSSRGDLPHFQ